MNKLFSILAFLLICVWQGKAQDAASATWALSAETQETVSLSGQLDDANLKFEGLAVNSYGSPDATMTVMLAEGGSTAWHTAEDAGRYLEFSISPKTGSKFHASEISIFVCGKGGGNVRANFYYSKDPTFANKTRINYRQDTDLTRDNSAGYEQMLVTVNETMEVGEKIYFRIYPYYKSAATGKYLCIKDAVISGTTEVTEIPASVVWPFISDLKPIVNGALLAEDMSYSSNTKQYAWDARVEIDQVKVSNGTFCTNTSNCLWTAATDIQEDVYVQYAVSPKTGATLTIKDVSLMIAATATGSMSAAVYSSKDATFATKTQLRSATKLPNNELEAWKMLLTTPEVIQSGETYYVRVYPFNSGTSDMTYKLVGIRNVSVSGTMIGVTYDPAEVNTASTVSYISTTTAISGGTITNDGGAPVTERGMVWATTTDPTIDNFKSVDGEGTGSFVSNLTGLTAGTTYYARAYATNKTGTAYGQEISFTTLPALVVPTVETTEILNIRNVTMVVSGKVTAWGGSDVTERGIVWGASTNPTVDGNKLIAGSDLGTFKGYIEGLTPENTYYARAYAINSTGVAYGQELSATTKATDPDITKVINPDGSADYTTVQDAFDAVPKDYTGKWIIRIKPGKYEERPTLESGKVNVFLIGEDAVTTIISHYTCAGMSKPEGGTWGTSGSQTMAIMADDFTAANITIENTHVNSKQNESVYSANQAVALKTQADRQSFYNCRVTGYQDTYLGNSIGRAYFKDCYIEGNVDFIFGRQTVVFDNCTTYVNRDGSVLTAPSTEKSTKFGMVFLDCKLTAPSTSYVDFNGTTFKGFYYGRPWQQQPKSAFIRCDVPATLQEKGWTTMSSGLNPVFVEYGCTGAGATADRLSKRGNEGKVISETEAAAYTIENIFKKDTDPSFAADWMPKNKLDIETSIIDNALTNSPFKSYGTPNPFNNEFTINYTLVNESKVVINLFDLQGKLLQEIENTNQIAGSYSATVNGSSLSAGLYFYSIKTENGTETQKIIKR